MSYISDINNSYRAALYIRLSKEDDDRSLESESVINQKSLLEQYASENSLKVYDIYIDDGFSGTNFDRPEFQRMINDIEIGKINMVITKDMSRLGRDYIGTGNLIEKYFPEHSVRYIAITDNVDTYLDSSNNDIAPFKSIMNDMYAKDISKKIRASFRAKQKDGKWVSGRCPFGYEIDKRNKNHLVVNEEKANVVRKIFDLALEGLSCFKIAKLLTSENVKTPASYYSFEWKENYNRINYKKWHSKTIKDILTNRMYTGDMVQNKRSKVSYKLEKIVLNDSSKFIITKGTHDAIVDKDKFYEVQKRLPKNIGRDEKKELHLLDGLLYCGNCCHRISVSSRRKKDNRCYTVCNYYRTYLDQKLCTVHSNNYDKLENVVISKLKEVCLKHLDKERIKECLLKSNFNNINNNEVLLKKIKQEIKQINDNLDSIYIDKLNKVIAKDMFERIKVRLENELKIKENKYNDLKRYNYKNELNNNNRLEKIIDEFLNFEKLNRELIVNLIDKIEIFEDKTINVKLNFKV